MIITRFNIFLFAYVERVEPLRQDVVVSLDGEIEHRDRRAYPHALGVRRHLVERVLAPSELAAPPSP